MATIWPVLATASRDNRKQPLGGWSNSSRSPEPSAAITRVVGRSSTIRVYMIVRRLAEMTGPQSMVSPLVSRVSFLVRRSIVATSQFSLRTRGQTMTSSSSGS